MQLLVKRGFQLKPKRTENAMQRKARLEKLAKAGDKAKKELGIKDDEKKDVNKHKWKGSY